MKFPSSAQIESNIGQHNNVTSDDAARRATRSLRQCGRREKRGAIAKIATLACSRHFFIVSHASDIIFQHSRIDTMRAAVTGRSHNKMIFRFFYLLGALSGDKFRVIDLGREPGKDKCFRVLQSGRR